MQNIDDKRLLEELRNNNLDVFEDFFRTTHPQLVSYANKFLDDWETSRDIVQEIFMKLWETREELEINSSLKAYLFAAVKNQCVNTIKHKIVEQKHSDSTMAQLKELEINYYQSDNAYTQLFEGEINKKLEESIKTLPEQCRITFELSRNKGMKSHEIAKKMDVSVRTVETQIYRALKVLKESLKEYLALF